MPSPPSFYPPNQDSSSASREPGKNKEGIFRMSELPAQGSASFISLSQTRKDQESRNVASPPDSKPKKKICCACPETKKLRDECIVLHGEDVCGKWIEAHRRCLRAEGFNV